MKFAILSKAIFQPIILKGFDKNFKYLQQSNSHIIKQDNNSKLMKVLTLYFSEPSDNDLQA